MSGSNDALEAMQADQAGRLSQQDQQAAPTQAAPTAPPPDMSGKSWQAAPDAQPIDVSGQYEQPKAEAGKSSLLKDMAKEAWASAQGMGASVLGAASYATRQLGASPETVAHIEKMRNAVEDHIQSTIESMSPEDQAATHASFFGGNTADGSGEHIPTPGEVGYGRYAAMTAASFVPDLMLAILPGGIAGKVGMKMAGEIGGKLASTAATGAAFGTVQLGDTYEQLVKTVDQSKPADWQGNPVMDHMLEQGMSFEDAKKNIVGASANHLAALQFGIGAVSGTAGGGLLLKGPLATAGKGALARMGLGAAEGAGLMGAAGGGQEAAQQGALQSIGLEKDFDTSKIARAAATGAVGGAVLGAGGGLLHGGEDHAQQAPQAEETHEVGASTSFIDPTTQAALNEHLAPEPAQTAGQPAPETTTVGTNPVAPTAAEQQLPSTQPGNAAPPEQGAAGPITPSQVQKRDGVGYNEAVKRAQSENGQATPARPSDGMKVGELRDALKTMPDQDPKVLARMSKTDLAAAYDKAQTPAVETPPTTVMQPDETRPVAQPENAQAPENQAAMDAAQPTAPAQPENAGPAEAPAIMATEAVPEPAPSDQATAPAPAAVAEPEAPTGPAKPVRQSARAKAKAQMAEGTRQKGESYVAPEVAADKSGAMAPADTTIEDQKASTAEKLRGALNKVKVVPIKKGTDLQPIMAKAMRDLYERVGKTDGSPDAAGEAIKEWSDANKGRIPQTHSTYQDVAAMVHREITGRDLVSARPEGIEETRQSDASREGGVSAGMRDEAKTEATREGGNVEKSEGVTDYGSGGESKMPTQHADRLPWALDRVMNGDMDVHEAERAIGTQQGGRTRTHATFADYLQHMVDKAQDPKAVEGIIEKMQKIDTQEFPTPQAKKAAGDRLRAELKLLDPDRMQDMKDKLSELRDPVHAVAGDAQPAQIEHETPMGRGPLEDTSRSSALRTPEVNAATDKLLADGVHTAKEHLDAIADNAAVPAEMRALARKLSGLVHKDVQVVADENTWGGAGTFWRMDETKGLGRIEVNHMAPDSRVETVMHEAIHSVVSHYIDSLPDNHPDMQALKAIGKELRDAANKADLSDNAREIIDYALANPHELHTMLLTNPRLQKLAAEAKPSVGFRLQMLKLGYPLEAAKNMWAAFTSFMRRALGLKGVATPENASVLDYALRPTTDILERAHAYNYGTDAQSLTEQAAFALPSFKQAKDEAIRAADFGGMGDKARRAVLQGATTDSIVDWNKKILPQIGDYRAANEAVAARSTKFRTDHGDDASTLANRLKGKDQLAQLMNDATIADAQLGTGANNAHLTTVGQQSKLTQLQGRFNALSKEDKQLYEDARDFYKATNTEEREAQLNGMLKQIMPGASAGQIAAMRAVVKTKASLEQFLKDPNNHSQFGSNGPYKSVQALAKGIAEVHKQGFVQGDYFPLRRFGDYVVNYGDKTNPDDYGVEMFEKRGDADARRAELVRLDPNQRVSQVLDKRSSKLRDMLPRTTVVDELVRAMEKDPALAAHADDAKDLLNSILLQHASRSARTMNSMRRRGVLGASTDATKVLAKDYLATSSRIGYLEHGMERTQALQAMRDHADTNLNNPREQIRAQAVIHELEQRLPSGDDASGMLTGAARKMTNLGFIQSLMSPSTMITHSIEAQTNAAALLGARHGVGRTSFELARAMKDVSPILATGLRKTGRAAQAVLGMQSKALKAADWNLSNVIRDRLIKAGNDQGQMTRLFQDWNNAGLIDHSQVREMQRIASGNSVTKGWWGKFMDLNSAGQHAVDVGNKTAIGLAAFRAELKKTGDETLARQYATDTIRKAMPNYNLSNKARITTDKGVLGGFAGPMTQFKNYGIHMYSMMANLARESINGATPADRREARKAFAGILATHTMMAGSLTLLGDPLRWIGGAYDFATGAQQPHDYENDVRQWMSDAFGPEVGEVMARGLPHLAGIDIHQRVGLSNLLEAPEMKSFDKKGVGDVLMQAMTGAAGEDAATMVGGVHKMLNGDLAGGLKDLVPRVLRDPMKAMSLNDKGVTDSTGKTIMKPEQLSGADIAAQAAGFQPSRVTEFREGRAAVQEAKTENSQRKTQLTKAWLQAEDPDDRADAKEAIDAWNHGHPGERITIQHLLQQKAAERKAANQPIGSFGLKMSKGQTRDLAGVGSFANTE
jgi:Large polyvalent protein associated domain 39